MTVIKAVLTVDVTLGCKEPLQPGQFLEEIPRVPRWKGTYKNQYWRLLRVLSSNLPPFLL